VRDPKIVHNDQPFEQLGSDESSFSFGPWPRIRKAVPEVSVLNELHSNRDGVFILERFQKLDEVLRVLSYVVISVMIHYTSKNETILLSEQ